MSFSEEEREYLNEIVGRINYQSHILKQLTEELRTQTHDSMFRRLVHALRPALYPTYVHITLVRLRADEIVPEPFIPEVDDEIPMDTPPQFPKQNRRPA